MNCSNDASSNYVKLTENYADLHDKRVTYLLTYLY